MNGFLSFRWALFVVATLAFHCPSGLGAERSIPAKGRADGQVTYQVNPTPEDPIGVQEYVAAGTGTLVGEFKGGGVSYFTADGSICGIFQYTAADGSTYCGSYAGVFFPIGDNLFGYEVVSVFEGGTGRLEGMGGSIRVVAVLDGLTGQFRYEFSGTGTLP